MDPVTKKEMELMKALEQVNAEYLALKAEETPEYILGRRILNFKKNFPFHLLPWLRQHFKNEDIKKKNESVTVRVKEEDLFYASPFDAEGTKGVVYTCITGGYDVPHEPVYKSDKVDYVLYTDKPCLDKKSIWQCHGLGTVPADPKGNGINRYYKFHPFELFENQYDYSIYIDGSVQTVSDIAPLYMIAKASRLGIAMHRHAARCCVYKEALWCKYNKRGDQKALEKQVTEYREEGFPEKYGLCEATIIVVDLHNQTAKRLLDMWWDEFCRSGSGRDQLSFPYILWKEGYHIEDIGCLGNDEYRNPKFRINAHKGKPY